MLFQELETTWTLENGYARRQDLERLSLIIAALFEN